MDKETEDYYDMMIELFATPGWKQFLEDVEEALNSKNNIMHINSVEDFWKNKGSCESLDIVSRYETAIRHGYEEAASND